ncbi:MAG: hypothetical protein R2849_17565 [Thermomicrobiales bacterium]
MSKKPYCGLETSFRATSPSGWPGPTVAVLAEYDALEGNGHGCGHNLIAGSRSRDGHRPEGGHGRDRRQLRRPGNSAEEGGGGQDWKMLDKWRVPDDDRCGADDPSRRKQERRAPSNWPRTGPVSPSAISSTNSSASHPTPRTTPYNGVNALDRGHRKLFIGIDALRQHIYMEIRIHGIITHGGATPPM